MQTIQTLTTEEKRAKILRLAALPKGCPDSLYSREQDQLRAQGRIETRFVYVTGGNQSPRIFLKAAA